MKKFAKLFFIFATAIFLTFCFTACKYSYPSKEEVRPKVLGKQEGLWLYKGNMRSRTDGSESESLLKEITLDGETYTADEFSIYNYCYAPQAHKIFFVLSVFELSVEDSYFLYLYDYEHKSGEYLSALPYEEIRMKLCENNTVCIDSENTNLIYDVEGNLLRATDGFESEVLLKEISVDGITYTADDISVYNFHYITKVHKIFFVLSVEDAYFLYLYDNEHKSGEYLSALPHEEIKIKLCENDTVYIDSENTKLIYDLEGNLLHEFHMPEEDQNSFEEYHILEADYQNGVFYKLYKHSIVVWEEGENDIYGPWQVVWIESEGGIHVGNWKHDYYIEWWEDGETHIAQLPDKFGFRTVKVTAGNIYLIGDKQITDVDKASEKAYGFNLGEVEYSSKYIDARRHVDDIYFDDAAYVFSVAYFYKNEHDTDWKYYLHKIQDGECTQVGEFDSGNYNTEMNVYQGGLYFRFDLDGRGGKNSYTYYKYDLSSGELKKIKEKDYHAEKALPTVEKKQVGEYSFYVTSVAYRRDNFIIMHVEHCYYLNREYNGKTEIMQYSFESEYLYDDICEF
ncbi:MAG: hypothetical protein K2G44_00725 [Clostridia bacterium]|nr:hypothetical protein [Clostridia bacterium]